MKKYRRLVRAFKPSKHRVEYGQPLEDGEWAVWCTCKWLEWAPYPCEARIKARNHYQLHGMIWKQSEEACE